VPETTIANPPPAPRIGKRNLWITLIWLVVAGSVAGMALSGPAGWDTLVYWNAIQSVHHGGDPYAEGIDAQQAFHNRPSPDPNAHPPMTYVYSPQTLPLLKLLTFFPGWLLGSVYWCSVACGLLLQFWACYQMASAGERRWLVYMVPLAALFPGLLNSDVILSGNTAYILYGLILAAAVPGWKRDRWLWFYLAVLTASICKAPLLTLLAFPVLVGRKQWIPAGITAAVGSLIFAGQPLLWPAQFREYLIAVRLQFDWNHDFGFGPAGVLGKVLWEPGQPHSTVTTIVYLVFAATLGGILLATGHRVRRRGLSREMWIPVALLGTLLLNPRIKEYDVAAITIPMLLIAWRTLRLAMDLSAQWRSGGHADTMASELSPMVVPARPDLALLLAGLGWFLAINVIAGTGEAWRPTELVVLLMLFSLGLWTIHRTVSRAAAS
jgi:hypothetical protein